MRDLRLIACLIALAFLLAPQGLRGAAKVAPLAVTFHRMVIALNDGWVCAVDSRGDAPRAEWAGTLPVDASAVALPLSWEHHPLKRNPETVEWYWRRVTYPVRMTTAGAYLVVANPVGMLEVYVDGAQQATVRGNGLTRRMLLHGAGGSQHLLALRLDRQALPEAIRRGASAGVGPVSLEMLPPVRIDACAALPDAGGKTLLVRYRLAAEEPCAATLHLQIFDVSGSERTQQTLPLEVLESGVNGRCRLSLLRCPRWSPETPLVYTLRVTLLCADGTGDMCEMPCGANDCTFEHGQLRIDDEPVLLKGMRLPGGIPLLTAPLAQTLAHELGLLRQTGFNSIMADGAALPEEALTIADHLGVMVIGDIPPAMPESDGVSHAEIRGAVEAFGSHPSLVAWSWQRGSASDEEVALLRSLDPNRAVLLRDGDKSHILLPSGASFPFADEDIDGTPTLPLPRDWPATIYQWEASKQPVLVSGFGITPLAGDDATGAAEAPGDDTPAQGEIRRVVESVRRSETSLGFFVRPWRGGSWTGLNTDSAIPTGAFTDAMGYNAQDLIVLRAARTQTVGHAPVVDAALINDSHHLGHYHLYQVLTSPAGQTAIQQYELTLTDQRVQDVSACVSLTNGEPGEYRLQLLLAGDSVGVIAASRVMTLRLRGQAEDHPGPVAGGAAP